MFDLAFLRAKGGPFQPIRFALRARIPLAWAAIGVGLLGLLISFAPVNNVLRPFVGTATTHPLTVLCLGALAFGILRTKRYGEGSFVRLGVLIAVVLICTARLMDGALAAGTGTATAVLFGPIGGFLGQFTLEAAFPLAAFAAAALVRHGNGRLGAGFLIFGLGCVFNSILGMAFGSTLLNGALGGLTVLGLTCTAGAMVSLYVHRPFVRTAFMIGDVGSQTRVMAAAIVLIPIGASVLLHRFEVSGGLAPIEVGVLSITSFSMLVVLLATSARHEGTVAARRRAEQDLAMRSRRDDLTGALNRFGMTEVVEGAWMEFKSTGAQFGMILIDLGYFRRLDATFGQDDGEAVLGRVAQTVQEQLRGLDALGRWDTNEFMVLLKIKDFSNIAIVADRLRWALTHAEKPFCAGLSMAPARIEMAFGIGAFEAEDDSAARAITRADIALHDAKTTEAQMIADLSDDMPFDLLVEPQEEKVEKTAAAA